MARQGSPGSTCMAKKTRLIAPKSMGIVTNNRRTTYCNTYVSPPVGQALPSPTCGTGPRCCLVQHLQHFWVVVAIVQGKLPVLRTKGGADPLGIPRPDVGHVYKGQT